MFEFGDATSLSTHLQPSLASCIHFLQFVLLYWAYILIISICRCANSIFMKAKLFALHQFLMKNLEKQLLAI